MVRQTRAYAADGWNPTDPLAKYLGPTIFKNCINKIGHSGDAYVFTENEKKEINQRICLLAIDDVLKMYCSQKTSGFFSENVHKVLAETIRKTISNAGVIGSKNMEHLVDTVKRQLEGDMLITSRSSKSNFANICRAIEREFGWEFKEEVREKLRTDDNPKLDTPGSSTTSSPKMSG